MASGDVLAMAATVTFRKSQSPQTHCTNENSADFIIIIDYSKPILLFRCIGYAIELFDMWLHMQQYSVLRYI
jgi:hypothetical protein